MERYCLGFECPDSSQRYILSGSIYNNYDDADKRRKEIQPNYKHRIEVFKV